MSEFKPPTRADVAEAQGRLTHLVRRTPVLAVSDTELFGPAVSSNASVSDANRFILKLEHLQCSGSFKARGASNFIAEASIADAGVVAASGGNHGAAVAYAARRAGHQATIFVPKISSPVKVERLRSYGADVRQVGSVYAESLEASMEFQAETNATSIHAYNHPLVMAGAGTTGSEFVEQAGGLDTILVACGGGGLAGGIACAVGSDVNVVVCETETTRSYSAAVAAGEPVDVAVSGVAADALGATSIGALAWQALSGVKAHGIMVSDTAVISAQEHLWQEFRLLVEPSAATTVAALQSGAYRAQPDERVGVLICGANTAR